MGAGSCCVDCGVPSWRDCECDDEMQLRQAAYDDLYDMYVVQPWLQELTETESVDG